MKRNLKADGRTQKPFKKRIFVDKKMGRQTVVERKMGRQTVVERRKTQREMRHETEKQSGENITAA